MRYYTIHHHTRYRYRAPVSESTMEMRLQPCTDRHQRCLSFQLEVLPQARVLSTKDYQKNTIHFFDIPRRHTELLLRAESLVLVHDAPPLPDALPAAEWDELAAATETGRYWEWLSPSHFACPTDHLAHFAQEINARRQNDPLTTLRQLNHDIHKAFEYTPASTSVDSPIDIALEQRRGVCQDFSHVMIALLRQLQIPARYVSGYLFQDEADLQDAAYGASHAWVEAYLPAIGWFGLDPTNDILADERHIRIALGRDYADVPPTKGIFKGNVESELSVGVWIVQAEEAQIEANLLDEQEWPVRAPEKADESAGPVQRVQQQQQQ